MVLSHIEKVLRLISVVDDTLNSHVGKRICGISERKTLPSQTCRLQHDAAILTKEFRAITRNARTQQKSPCLAPHANPDSQKGRNYRCLFLTKIFWETPEKILVDRGRVVRHSDKLWEISFFQAI